MSKVTQSAKPLAAATAAAARTPPAGPDSSSAAGRSAATSTGSSPPADDRTSTSRRQAGEAAEVGAAHRPQVGVHRRRDRPLVLPELRATPRSSSVTSMPRSPQDGGHGLLVAVVEVGVQQADGDGRRPRRAASASAGGIDRLELAPVGAEPARHAEAEARATSGSGRSAKGS